MATSTGPARFRTGAGRLSLDFIRTLRYRGTPHAIEELPDGAALTAWVRQCGPCADQPRSLPDDALLGAAREVREAVAVLIAAGRRGDGLGAHRHGDDGHAVRSAVARVNQAAAGGVPAPALDPDGGLRWYAADPVAAAVALIARDALDLVSSPAIERVRGCADPTCGALFLDSSRPGTRRWCSMGACGNKAKKHTLRARQPLRDRGA